MDRRRTIEEIRRQTRQLVRELDVLKSTYLNTGYTFTQCHVLFEISARKSINLMKLAENLLLDKSNTSRTVKKLVELGLVKVEKVATDQRQRRFSLTAKGQKALKATIEVANVQVQDALNNLSQSQQEDAIRGMGLYANALKKGRVQEGYTVRPIRKRDNSDVAALIREVMHEYGAVGEGYSIVDPEVDDMYGNYQAARACYYVVACDDEIVGTGGIAPLRGGERSTCELRKMFFKKKARGLGLGRRLLLLLLDEARERDYKRCYLETLSHMTEATRLYRQSGFHLLDRPTGKTGHTACDEWYQLELG